MVLKGNHKEHHFGSPEKDTHMCLSGSNTSLLRWTSWSRQEFDVGLPAVQLPDIRGSEVSNSYRGGEAEAMLDIPKPKYVCV